MVFFSTEEKMVKKRQLTKPYSFAVGKFACGKRLTLETTFSIDSRSPTEKQIMTRSASP
jgi:hypothetical protein